ncbi:hypothetical protein C8N36_12613 [Pelagimonas varians]|uniref:Uncharacterized protein n=1 Tax=Pelagimonas varians TaxID=696760 RepID=A0A238L6Q2_9RHOB|nr:hypothetical protein C8N36_12613 [Pelagimonas varians]SMX50062.1 hypothetical protein PEV8663_04466 [Pelagimonas varians]
MGHPVKLKIAAFTLMIAPLRPASKTQEMLWADNLRSKLDWFQIGSRSTLTGAIVVPANHWQS